MTRWILVVIIGTIVGCASSSPPASVRARPSTVLLGKADRLVSQGQYAGAIEAYGEILAKYPDTDEAAHARGSRETIQNLLATRAQLARVAADMKAQEAELARAREQASAAREQATARDAELSRARQEIARLTAEADRLRADLENLKKIDIDLERRRK